MPYDLDAAIEYRRAAVRMVAAAEYFKAAGDLPPWARADLDSWNDADAIATATVPASAVAREVHR